MSRTPRMIRFRWGTWRVPAIGTAIGLAYGLFSQQLDFETMKNPKLWESIDDIVSVILPTVAGLLAGFVFNHVRWQARINQTLSTQNAKFRRHLLAQTLSAHILHEIRNPLHNLTALLEGWQPPLGPEDASLLQRNLGRLRTVITQLSRWALGDAIDVREPVPLGPWLDEFVLDKVRSQLHHAAIGFEPRVDRVVVNMHPLLLEQCFTTLFNNAMEAIARGHGARTISLSAALSTSRGGYVEIRIRNTGTSYPDPVLATQGREAIESPYGLGLGLVLARRTLELVEGSLALANEDGHASTTLWIPGQQA